MSLPRRLVRPAWLPRLTVRGVAFLVVGAGIVVNALIVGRRDLLFVGFLLIAVPVAAAIYLGFTSVQVNVTRSFRPAVVSARTRATVSLRLQNRSAGTLDGVRWRDASSAGLDTPEPADIPAPVRTGNRQEVRLEYSITPALRGIYDVGPLALHQYDPFGLLYRERIAGESNDLVVTPPVTALPGQITLHSTGEGVLQERIRQHTPHADELIAREYRPGDPLRRVNWPATARHGEIMVRQEEQRSSPSARLILDTTRMRGSASRGTGERRANNAFELAIECAASVGVHLLQDGYQVELVELGPSQLGAAGGGYGGLHGDPPAVYRGMGGARMLLEGMAGLVPVDRRSHPSGVDPAVSNAHGVQPTFAVLVAFTEQDVGDLIALRPHCEPAVVFVIDPDTVGVADRLEGGGWRCVPVRHSAEIVNAWVAALGSGGRQDAAG